MRRRYNAGHAARSAQRRDREDATVDHGSPSQPREHREMRPEGLQPATELVSAHHKKPRVRRRDAAGLKYVDDQ
jgi:hypothetical protein